MLSFWLVADQSALASTASTTIAGSASGQVLTFDGRGTAIASTVLPADAFHGASGLTFSAWIRVFGLMAEAPFRAVPVSLWTPALTDLFRP